MSKKLLLFLLTFTMIMFVGINVKAGCTRHACNGTDSNGASCSYRSGKEACEADSNCSYDCTGCATGETLYNGSCSCPTPADFTAGGCTGLYSSHGAQGNGCDVTPTGDEYSYSSNLTQASVDSSGHVTIADIDSSTCRTSFKITVTRTNACGATRTKETGGEAMVPWPTTPSKKVCVKTPVNQATAEANNKSSYHNGCVNNSSKCGSYKDENGKEVPYQYCDKYSRGCGTENPEPEPGCFRDGNGFLWWDSTGKTYQTYTNGKWTDNTGYKRTNLPYDKCYTKFKCSIKNEAARTVETTCNETHVPNSEAGTNTNELSGTYINKCGILYDDGTIGEKQSDGTEKFLFYKITCEEKMKTAFNGPIFDSESSFLYPGTGFGFNYFAKTIVSCKGYWDNTFYSAASTYVSTYIENRFKSSSFQQDDEDDKISKEFYSSALSALNGVATRYKNWKVNYYSTGKPTGTIKDIQPDGKVQKKDWHLFNLVFNELSVDGDSYCGELPNGELKASFTYQELHNMQMKLPILWYDKTASYVSETDNQYKVKECSTLDDENCLGRIFPISDSKEFAGSEYKYEVRVNGLGWKNNWTNYETCDINMREKQIYFRQINLGDPFVQKLNPDRGIGANWKNAKFNFINLIDPNIWSKASEYNMIRITEEDGRNIKQELNSNTGYYSGICSTGSASVASTICAKYNQAVNGK